MITTGHIGNQGCSNWRRAIVQPAWLVLVWLSAPAVAQQPSTVVVAEAQTRDITTTQSFVGTVRPARSSLGGSAGEGRVIEFLAHEGLGVKKGDVLARLRTDTLKIQADAAKAELALRQSELDELKNSPLPEEAEQAVARMKRAQIGMENAKRKWGRTKKLFDSNAVTDDEMDEAELDFQQSEQAYLEAKASHQLVMDGPRPEKIAQAQARVDTQAKNVELIEDEISKHTIVAPFDGFVVTESSQLGQWVQRGGEICQLVQLDEVDVKVYILASQIRAITVGLSVELQLPHDPSRRLPGQVIRIIPQTDENSRAIPVRIRVKNPQTDKQPLLKSGMLANAILPTEIRQQVTVVPKDALVLNPRETVLYVVDENDGKMQARKVRVTPGTTDGSWIEVRGDIQSGQRVVVEGNERLRDKSSVTIQSVRSYSSTPVDTATR